MDLPNLVFENNINLITVLEVEQTPEKSETPKPKKKIHTVVNGDNLNKIAKKYKTTWQRLYYKNKKIKDPNVIKVGQKITIPKASEKLEKRDYFIPEPTPTITSNTPQGQPTQATESIQTVSTPVGHGNFDWGWCTYHAQALRPDKLFAGNARDWMVFVNGYEPKIGAVAVNTYAAGGYGHVGVVRDVSDTQILVEHMNYKGFGVITKDWVDKAYWSGYIY